jgi:hypothetical protein
MDMIISRLLCEKAWTTSTMGARITITTGDFLVLCRTGNLIRMGQIRNTKNNLAGNTRRLGPLRKPRCIWEDSVKMDLRKTERELEGWIYLAKDRVERRAVLHEVKNEELYLLGYNAK